MFFDLEKFLNIFKIFLRVRKIFSEGKKIFKNFLKIFSFIFWTCKTILDGKIFFERQNRPYCRLHAIKAAIADSQKTTK